MATSSRSGVPANPRVTYFNSSQFILRDNGTVLQQKSFFSKSISCGSDGFYSIYTCVCVCVFWYYVRYYCTQCIEYTYSLKLFMFRERFVRLYTWKDVFGAYIKQITIVINYACRNMVVTWIAGENSGRMKKENRYFFKGNAHLLPFAEIRYKGVIYRSSRVLSPARETCAKLVVPVYAKQPGKLISYSAYTVAL